MLDHIIVPVDLSDQNAVAVRTAIDLARGAGGFITLLHVVETLDLPYEEVAEFYDRLEARAAARLEEIAVPLAEAGVEFEQLVLFGDPAVEIIEFAASSSGSLIVLRSHRIEPDQPTGGWATLSYKLAILSETPILLVKQGSKAEEGPEHEGFETP